MLHLFYSNRYETLTEALLIDLQALPPEPWTAWQIVVPSAAARRRLELDIAQRCGVCANVEFSYLAQWLWTQIGKVLPTPEHSPFAPQRLVWRCYRLLGEHHAPRLAAYLAAADPLMRYELAQRVATVFDHYLTYRPEWLMHWRAGESIFTSEPGLTGATAAQREDEQWQAALWRALLNELNEAMPSAYRFLEQAPTFDLHDVMRARWPAAVSVFALPTMPPLYIALLRELSRWIDVRVYALNPCREFWFDIVSEAREAALAAADQLDFQEVGHPLLAEWGKQTQAQLHMLHELTENAASTDAARYTENPADTWLARVQNAMLNLQPESVASVAFGVPATAGIEVHACHSLLRQLEVLHDRLLGWFDELDDLAPADVLVACADLAAAAPLIEAVFGAAGETQRIPYRITGLPPSQANPIAATLLAWLTLTERSIGAPELLEWLRIDALAARYEIDATALDIIQHWLVAACARRGFSALDLNPNPNPNLNPLDDSSREHSFAGHGLADALMRLFLGYAMPDGSEPVDAWLPIEGASGANSELLGRLAHFVDDLEDFVTRASQPQTPQAWGELLGQALARFFDAGVLFSDLLAEARDALNTCIEAMQEGVSDTALPAAIIREALAAALDDPARGGVPWGSVTFSSLTSLRGLPYRIVCVIGMDDGVLPSRGRADEFDLMAVFGKLGDRQRRVDERNLFLDLLLAARDRFMVSYTGRGIQDNAPLPPAALTADLLDHLARAAVGPEATFETVRHARHAFIVEHPLQAYSANYFPTHANGPLFTYNEERARLAEAIASGGQAPRPFFAAPLPPKSEEQDASIAFDLFKYFWRHPARALLRERLHVALADGPDELLDSEPFEVDYLGRDALAKRLLPILLAGEDQNANNVNNARARRIARASPELPNGATGAVWRAYEVSALSRLATKVRDELHGERHDTRTASPEPVSFALDIAPCWPDTQGVALFGAHDAMLRAELNLTPVVLTGALNTLGDAGQVLFRYASPSAGDYLNAWLAHLAYCAACPEGPKRTIWLGRDAHFELLPVAQPLDELAPLLALYRAGQRLPLRFFPKSAWAQHRKGDSAAWSIWRNERKEHTRSEADDPALRIAWRGAVPTLDEAFKTLARIVFEPLTRHLGSES